MSRCATMVSLASTLVGALALPVLVFAQGVEPVGTRALGLAGAFTAVADDASAIRWNPAGTATGDYVSVVLNHAVHESGEQVDDPVAEVVRGSGTLVAFSVPVVGLGYYRIDQTWFALPVALNTGPGESPRWVRRAESLVTDHFVLSVAQTLADGLHVGLAVKAVRGSAARGLVMGSSLRQAADASRSWPGSAEARTASATRWDADLGVMVDRRWLRVGLAVQNLAQPRFPVAGTGGWVGLERTARVGVAWLPTGRLTAAVDADLTTAERVLTGGEGAAELRWRPLAAGVEVWGASRRLGVRGGVRMQTVGQARPLGTGGASLRVGGRVSVDVHGGLGADGHREWSLGGRVAF